MAKLVNFGPDPHTFDAKTDPSIPFGANLFVYLKHIGIQIIETITGKILCCLTFLQNTGLKKPVCEPSPLKRLAIFCGCAARFVSDLVGNPEDRFSHDAAYLMFRDTAAAI